MSRIALRVMALEQDARHVRRLSHVEAIAELDAHPCPHPDGPRLTDAELDAVWNRRMREWGDAA